MGRMDPKTTDELQYRNSYVLSQNTLLLEAFRKAGELSFV